MPLRHLKYSNKIKILFIPVFVLMAVGLLIVYNIAAKSMQDEHQERLRRTAHLTEDGLRSTAKEMLKIVHLFQSNRTVKEYVYLSTVLGGDRKPLRDLLEPLAASLEINDLDVFDRQGRRILDLDPRTNQEARITDFASELPAEPKYGFVQEGNVLKILALAPLRDSRGTIGYISVGRYIDDQYIQQLKGVSGDELFWVDSQNRMHPSANNGSVTYEPNRAKLSRNGAIYSVMERMIAGFNGNQLGMLVIALSDADLDVSITKLKVSMFGLLIVAALLSLVISRLFIKTLVEPLDAITRFTGKVARGELDEELTISGKDEITALAGHFNEMRKNLKAQRDVVQQHTGNLERAVEERTAELQKVQRQLLQSQKMEAVGQLAGGIAHDFNNFLTVIIGFAGIFQKKLKKEDPLRPYADEIVATSRRAANLTRSLLTFSRKQIINPLPVDLNEIIREAEKIMLRLIGEHIELKAALPEMPLTVTADRGQLQQVLLNLATNARDAMPEGGCLIIETRTVSLDEAFALRNGWGRPGRYALLTVTDTGTGMDEATREKAFEPFFTTKEAGKGTGLGLAMVYGIIQQHKGFINIYSEPGVGTTVKIYLPLIHLQAADTASEDKAADLPSGTETILLAEDNPAVRQLAASSLADAGYTVITAADGDEAVKTFLAQKDRVQMLVLDVIMPHKNGKTVYEEVRKIRPDVKVLFVSGYMADMLHTRGVLDPGIQLVQKPMSMDDLLLKVRCVLDS